ncbi:MAG: citrate lyase ACP [Gemmatimonadetes bacterium]|nr:citrate lyase ACP [Gemmatimonadota bacterium]
MQPGTIAPVPEVATAGRRGADVRSDVHVSVEPTSGGQIELGIESKVGSLYGDSIRVDVMELLLTAGVKSARVQLEDQGALPFVIAARVEAALRRAGHATGDLRPARSAPVHAPSPRDRVRRSRLYLPGNEPKFMLNAALHHPDAVILDLEDSVHHDEKDTARLLVRNALRCLDFGAAERMVRINTWPLGQMDLEAVEPEGPAPILIPKVEHERQVVEVARAIRRFMPGRQVHIMPILESALGIENAFAIARADPFVVALTSGLEGSTAALGVSKTAEGAESLYARCRLVNAAKAADLQAIDSVFGDVGDVEGLRSWGERARALGFDGMGCIHPRQIEVIHKAFAPSAAELEKAQRIVAAFEDAQRRGVSVVSLGTRMVDPPVVLRAQRLVAEARRQGLLLEVEK